MGDVGAVRVVEGHELFKLIVNEYPLSFVVAESLTYDVTVKDSLVPWKELSLVDIVTVRSVTEIQGIVVGSGENVKVSVKLQPGSYVQAIIVQL